MVTTTTTTTTGMKSSKRFSLKRLGLNRLKKKVLSHLRRPSNEKAIRIDADYAPSTESSEPRSGDNLELEISSQAENTTLTDEQDTGSQRKELETEKESSQTEEEGIQTGEVNLVTSPDDRGDLPTPLEKKSVEEEHQGGEVNGASADSSTAGDAEDQPIPQEESQGGEVSRALSGMSSKRSDKASASIAKSTSGLGQGILAQSSSKAVITGSVASRCATKTGSIHSQIQTKASCEFIATSPIPSKVETNDDVNLIMSEVVGSESSSSDHDNESQADDEAATKTIAANDDTGDAFDADNDIAPTSSKLSMRSAISKLSHASKKSVKSLVSAARSSKSNITAASAKSKNSKYTSASTTRSLKSAASANSKNSKYASASATRSLKSAASAKSKNSKYTAASATRSLKSTNSKKSIVAFCKSAKSDAESVATVPRPDIDSKCSLSMLTNDSSVDESTNSTSKAAFFTSTKSDAKSVVTVPQPAIEGKCSLSMLLSDPSAADEQSCDDCQSTTSATYFVNEHADGEIEIETIIDEPLSIPTVSLYSFHSASNCDYTPGELLPL